VIARQAGLEQVLPTRLASVLAVAIEKSSRTIAYEASVRYIRQPALSKNVAGEGSGKNAAGRRAESNIAACGFVIQQERDDRIELRK
jgi:hypothetical protein